MLTMDSLRAWGANADEGLARCVNNEAFYFRMIGILLGDSGFAELENAIAANDLKAGFEAAHKLKGVAANLSLTPLYDAVSEITELLRAGTQTDYAPYLAAIAQKKAELEKICE